MDTEESTGANLKGRNQTLPTPKAENKTKKPKKQVDVAISAAQKTKVLYLATVATAQSLQVQIRSNESWHWANNEAMTGRINTKLKEVLQANDEVSSAFFATDIKGFRKQFVDLEKIYPRLVAIPESLNLKVQELQTEIRRLNAMHVAQSAC